VKRFSKGEATRARSNAVDQRKVSTGADGVGQNATLRNAALAILIFAFATIASAWIYEAMGYLPCELCLKQRIPYYLALPVAALATLLAHRGRAGPARICLAALAALFLAGAALAAYHSGVEWKIFEGPTDCSGALNKAGSVEAFIQQLQSVKVVRCDEPALWVLGLTLSNWNVLISLALAGIAIAARRRA
jgi:disulfide bond formation protein DsbB